MKRLLLLLIPALVANSSFGFVTPGNIRTISNISSIPQRVLQRTISPKFYQSLLISPVEGYVAVRGQIDGTHLTGLRVVHSELDGAYDSLALDRAKAVTIVGYYGLDRSNKSGNVVVHLLIYKIADGTMALSFANIDEPGGDQQERRNQHGLRICLREEQNHLQCQQGKRQVHQTQENCSHPPKPVDPELHDWSLASKLIKPEQYRHGLCLAHEMSPVQFVEIEFGPTRSKPLQISILR